jgi:hypothetical protein
MGLAMTSVRPTGCGGNCRHEREKKEIFHLESGAGALHGIPLAFIRLLLSHLRNRNRREVK